MLSGNKTIKNQMHQQPLSHVFIKHIYNQVKFLFYITAK